NGSPMYARLPKKSDQARVERIYPAPGKWTPLIRTLASHEDLARPEAIAARDEPPGFLFDATPVLAERLDLVHDTIALGSMLAYTRSFTAEGRTWLLSADLTLVPADRTRPFRASTFRGVRLGEQAKLPLAWFRTVARPKY